MARPFALPAPAALLLDGDASALPYFYASLVRVDRTWCEIECVGGERVVIDLGARCVKAVGADGSEARLGGLRPEAVSRIAACLERYRKLESRLRC